MEMIEERIPLKKLSINAKFSLNDKPVVLLLHFSGGNLHMWDGVLPQLEQDYSILAPDLRGMAVRTSRRLAIILTRWQRICICY